MSVGTLTPRIVVVVNSTMADAEETRIISSTNNHVCHVAKRSTKSHQHRHNDQNQHHLTHQHLKQNWNHSARNTVSCHLKWATVVPWNVVTSTIVKKVFANCLDMAAAAAIKIISNRSKNANSIVATRRIHVVCHQLRVVVKRISRDSITIIAVINVPNSNTQDVMAIETISILKVNAEHNVNQIVPPRNQ